MAYILGQYNHNKDNQKDWLQLISNKYEIAPVYTKSNLENAIPFEDVGFRLTGNDASFVLGQTYYCHCKIKRQSEAQKIALKLINFAGNDAHSDDEEESYEQYIKIINIQECADNINQWTDIEFIFTPQGNNFNTILFNLTRTSSDYTGISRKMNIAFLEVSIVNNIQDIFPLNEGRLLLKMGIQSRPGLRMVINREEIYIGRTGVYEIKNGEIKINFISFTAPSTNKTDEELIDVNKSISFLDEVPATRAFDSFTLDYIYEQD